MMMGNGKTIVPLLGKLQKNPWYAFSSLGGHGLLNWMPDDIYLKLAFRGFTGKRLDLKNPKTFNEKLQWLKLYDRNPLYTTLVDKYRVKPWVAKQIGSQYVTETYDAWESVDDIDVDILPERFVLKTNHDSGGVVICRDRKTFDFDAAKKKLRRHLDTNMFWYAREWPYKNVKPLVFAEEYLEPDVSADDLYDYKLFHFNNGRIITLAMTDRFTGGLLSETFFDEEWRPLPLSEGEHPNRFELKCPESFEQMKRMAKRLGQAFPFTRVDFYESRKGLYFGEMTLYPKAGFEDFSPAEWDAVLGSWIDLDGGGVALHK